MRRCIPFAVSIFICGAIIGLCSPPVAAQQPAGQPLILNRPYDGLSAGAEAYLNAEAQRRQNIARQLGHVEQLTWSLGLPNRTDGVVWYRDPPSLDYWYAYGRPAAALYSRRLVAGSADVFEPWPRVPGDIFGYPDPAPVRQPIGHISSQTGPNRWEYHPIYAEDLAPQPAPCSLRRRISRQRRGAGGSPALWIPTAERPRGASAAATRRRPRRRRRPAGVLNFPLHTADTSGFPSRFQAHKTESLAKDLRRCFSALSFASASGYLQAAGRDWVWLPAASMMVNPHRSLSAVRFTNASSTATYWSASALGIHDRAANSRKR